MKKEIIKKLLLKYPEGNKTKNKYKILTLMAKELFSDLSNIENKRLSDIIYTVVNADRDWRKLTEKEDKENKKILSQQWQLDNGYTVGDNKQLTIGL